MFNQSNTYWRVWFKLLSYHGVSEFKIIYPIKLNYNPYPGSCLNTHKDKHQINIG